MFRSNLKKIKDVEKDIERSSREHHRRKSLAQKRYERISDKVEKSRSSDLKKRVKEKMNLY